jgi:hypothetical protein
VRLATCGELRPTGLSAGTRVYVARIGLGTGVRDFLPPEDAYNLDYRQHAPPAHEQPALETSGAGGRGGARRTSVSGQRAGITGHLREKTLRTSGELGENRYHAGCKIGKNEGVCIVRSCGRSGAVRRCVRRGSPVRPLRCGERVCLAHVERHQRGPQEQRGARPVAPALSLWTICVAASDRLRPVPLHRAPLGRCRTPAGTRGTIKLRGKAAAFRRRMKQRGVWL